MSTCLTCGKLIPEPNTAYGINPQALCACCVHDRRAAPSIESAAAGGYHAGRPFLGTTPPTPINKAGAPIMVTSTEPAKFDPTLPPAPSALTMPEEPQDIRVARKFVDKDEDSSFTTALNYIDILRSTLAAALEQINEWKTLAYKMERRAAENEKDAERYRWLHQVGLQMITDFPLTYSVTFQTIWKYGNIDAAIDAAREKEGKG